MELKVAGCKLSQNKARLPKSLIHVLKKNPQLEKKIENSIKLLDSNDDLISGPGVSQESVFNERERIKEEYLRPVAGVGTVIERARKKAFIDDLKTLEEQVKKFAEGIEAKLAERFERVAYTWFNRLAALRFMDAHGWHPFRARVLTPASAAETQPELLKLARTGALPEELKAHPDPARLNDLLDGRIPTPDAQGEVYRHIVLAACRFYHALLPSLFEKLDDETELLLPDDLLTEHSVVHGFRTEISDEDCGDGQRANVEILGWLYQFYSSERKDQVMARKSAVPTEDIPAVTQLFTPHWIVLSNEIRKGDWSEINQGGGPLPPPTKSPVEHPVFHLWLNHDVAPSGSNYAYYVCPSLDACEMETSDAGRLPEILLNRPEVQAVGLGPTLQIAFWQPGRVTWPNHLDIAVDRPCLLLLVQKTEVVHVTLSNPTNREELVVVELTNLEEAGAGQRPSVPRKLYCNLPGGDSAGKSRTWEVRLND